MKELVLISLLGVLALPAGLLKLRKFFMVPVLLGLIVNIIFSINDWNTNENVYNMLLLDNFALAFNIVSSIIAILWFILSSAYFKNDESFSDHFAMVLFAMCGGFLMASFTNMVMLFLGIEILSIPLFVLAGSHKNRLQSNEAAFKYFLLGAFASAFLLFGIALLYGATGHFDNAGIASSLSSTGLSPIAFTGIIMMIAAMTFKVSAAPFHFWAPDVYQGSPTMISAFMATFVKTVAFAAFYRLVLSTFVSFSEYYIHIFALIAAATMLIANITASVQINVKRMLAFSGISHAGFMSITLLCIKSNTAGILLYYTLVYSVSSLIAFTIFKIVKSNSNEVEELDAFNGLLRRNRSLSAMMAFALLSMSGIPPLAGFMAKYLVFTAAIGNGYIWVAVCGIIASLIAVYYYFKLILGMFGREASLPAFKVSGVHMFGLLICTALLFLLMVAPGLIMSLI